MLLRFKLKNYKTFVDEVIFDMTAVSIKDHYESLINVNGINLLPVSAIFGANASGKSNFFKAVETMRNQVLGFVNDTNFIRHYTQYYFDEAIAKSPTEFEVCICNKELKKEYRYGYSILDKTILEEWLFIKTFSKTPSVTEECIFYRKKGKKIFTEDSSESRRQEILFVDSVTTNNELIVTNLGKRNKDRNAFVFSWFRNNVMSLNYSDSFFENINIQRLLQLMKNNQHATTLVESLVSKVDPEIKNILIENDDNGTMRVYAIHNDVNNAKVKVPFGAESCGTKKIFSLALYIMTSLENGITIFVDELDSKLHPLLLRFLVSLYTNKEHNKGEGQLIFSSHNLVCLDSNDLRRDEIWFVEKNNQKSNMFSLYDFNETPIRKDLDFGKHYLSGRFGAVPFVEEN